MKTVGWQPMLPGNVPMTVIFTRELIHSTGPDVGTPVPDQKELVYREEAEAEVAAAMQNLRAHREDSETEITRLKGLLELSNTDLGLMHKRHDEMLEQLLETRRSAKGWEDTAAMFHRNQQYYERIVRLVGALFGPPAYTSDDGSIQDEVLAEKVIELAVERFGKPAPGKSRIARAWNALLGR